MDPRRWSAVRQLFERALELPPLERGRFVEHETSGDDELAAELRRLLANLDDSTAFLAPPDERELGARISAAFLPSAGERIGSYRLERVLGSGGMGTVFLARQERPARKVALKVMRVGLGSPAAVRRFQVEAEILGALRHPGIATIFELGTHGGASWSDGLPFFAMEFVEDARDLATFARERGLSVRERIELFQKVCAAVQHAHQKGVIHRDLKPGNVLVDASGQPKVIDFGVARVLASDASRALTTLGGQIFGTLMYASPEQVSGDPHDVDLRADVYSLGAVLYELLAGRPPIEGEGRSIGELVLDVAQRVPPPPSSVTRGLDRELDWIVLACLRKDRDERYGSAEELSAELARYLADEPVHAGPPTARYRARKFVARNRLAVGAASIVVASLVGAVVVTGKALTTANTALAAQIAQDGRTREALRRETEAHQQAESARTAQAAQTERAKVALRRQTAVVDALGGLFDAIAPDADGRKVTVVELLERRRSKLALDVSDDPELRAALQEFLATAYFNLGEVESAGELAEQSLALLESQPDAGDVLVARLRLRLALVRTRQGRYEEARELVEPCIARLENAGHLHTSLGLNALQQMAELDSWAGRRDLAVDAYRDLVPLASEVLGPDDPQTLQVISNLAMHLARMRGGEEEAECWARRAHERATAQFAATHPLVLMTSERLADVLFARAKVDEAIELLRGQLEPLTELYGESHFNTLQTLEQLARWMAQVRRVEEAEPLARRALELTLRDRGDDPELEFDARNTLAIVLDARGELDEQAQQIEASIRRLESDGHGDTLDMPILYVRMAKIELAAGRPDAAETHARLAVEHAGRHYPPDHVVALVARTRLGQALVAQRRFTEAEAELRESYDLASQSSERQPPTLIADMLRGLVEVYVGLDRDRERADAQSALDAID